MGTHHIVAAAMTLLTADNCKFVIDKKSLTNHSRTFKDLEEDFGGILPEEYSCDMGRDEAKLFCAALQQDPAHAAAFCDTLSPSDIMRFLPVADYYDMSAYMPVLPKAFVRKIRSDAEHKKLMAGVFPRQSAYPILRLLLAQEVIRMPAFFDQSMGSHDSRRPSVFSRHFNLYRPIRMLRFSSDGRKLFVVCSDSVIRVYDVAAESIDQELTRNYSEQVTDCVPVADGRVLATSSGHVVRTWEADDSGIYDDEGAIGCHASDIVGLSSVPTSPHQVVSAAVNGEILLWDVEHQKKILDFDMTSIFSTAPTVSPNNQIAIGSQFGELMLFDMQSKSVIYDSIIYSFGIVPYFDSHGRLIITTAEGSLKIFDQAKNQLRTGLNFAGPLRNFAATPEGTFYVVRTAQQSLVVLKAEGFKKIRTTISSNERPLAVWADHPRALRVASNYNSNLIIHDITARKTLASQLLKQYAQDCTHEQLMFFVALDRDIERGENTETFFKRAPALYPYYKSLPREVRGVLNKEFKLKNPSIPQQVSLMLADFPFF